MFFGGNPVTVSPPAYAPTRESSSRARPGAPTGLRGAPTVPFRSVSRQDPPKWGSNWRSLRGLRLSRGAFGGTPVPIMGRRVPPNGREALAKRDIMQPPARFQDGLKAPPASTPLTEISPFVTRPIRWIRGGSSRMQFSARERRGGRAGGARSRRGKRSRSAAATVGEPGSRTATVERERRSSRSAAPGGLTARQRQQEYEDPERYGDPAQHPPEARRFMPDPDGPAPPAHRAPVGEGAGLPVQGAAGAPERRACRAAGRGPAPVEPCRTNPARSSLAAPRFELGDRHPAHPPMF